MTMDFCTRCNLAATFQMLLINKFLTDLLYRKSDQTYHEFEQGDGDFSSLVDNALYRESSTSYMGRKIVWILLVVFTYLLTAVDDVMTALMIWERIIEHMDLFNIGVIVGKVLRAVLSIYFNGFWFYQNYFELFSELINM